MRSFRSFGLPVLALVLASCDAGTKTAATHTFDLRPDVWTVGFADLPVDHDPALYQLEYGSRSLPSGLDGDGLYVQGHNRSADLFMFLKTQVHGLTPRTGYRITFAVDVATCVAEGMVGVGGSPGESVFLKAGATPLEPVVFADEAGYLRMNIDKGNQAREGANMIILGNIAHPDLTGAAGEKFMIKRLENTGHDFRATSDADGNMWVIVGTDSGFEGLTTLYYGEVSVVLEETDD